MNRFLQWVRGAVLLLAASAANASYHTLRIEQIFSNADGTIQFIVLHESHGMDGENLLGGHTLTATQGTMTNTYFFNKDLPGGSCDYYSCMPAPTANRYVLIATQGFAALNLVTPNYVVQNGFLPLGNGTLNYADVDIVSYSGLPADGVSALTRTGTLVPNVATNFAGQTASVSLGGPTNANYGGLWWAAPGGVENGWGINFAHQGKVIFGTWFTYDTTGKGWWLTLITETNPSPGVYTAGLYVTTGPPFNAVPFNKTSGATKVGTATLNFTDASNGTFHYELTLPGGTVSQTKTITQQQLAAPPLASCAAATQSLTAATNYQDIWWAGTSASPGTEQGWGINFAHQGDLVFASWFTYDLDGTPLWVVATAAKTAPGVYKGDLYRPSGPRFDAYDKSQWKPNPSVGSLTLTFVNGNNATMDYTLLGMPTQHKIITRQVFSGTGTACK
jgi:hypothetical protein